MLKTLAASLVDLCCLQHEQLHQPQHYETIHFSPVAKFHTCIENQKTAIINHNIEMSAEPLRECCYERKKARMPSEN